MPMTRTLRSRVHAWFVRFSSWPVPRYRTSRCALYEKNPSAAARTSRKSAFIGSTYLDREAATRGQGDLGTRGLGTSHEATTSERVSGGQKRTTSRNGAC